MMKELEAKVTDPAFVGTELVAPSSGRTYTVAQGDNFQYTDPIDQSVAKGQVSLFHPWTRSFYYYLLLYNTDVMSEYRVYEFCSLTAHDWCTA